MLSQSCYIYFFLYIVFVRIILGIFTFRERAMRFLDSPAFLPVEKYFSHFSEILSLGFVRKITEIWKALIMFTVPEALRRDKERSNTNANKFTLLHAVVRRYTNKYYYNQKFKVPPPPSRVYCVFK